MHYFTPDELTAVLRVAQARNDLHHLAMLTSVCHGLRVSELLVLRPTDVPFPALSLTRLKGERAQFQPLHESSDPLYDEATAMGRRLRTGADPLFPVTRGRLDQVIRRCGKLAGVPSVKLHWHTFRHTTAMLVWAESHSLSQVQQVLGHRDIRTSLIYLHEYDHSVGLGNLSLALDRLAGA